MGYVYLLLSADKDGNEVFKIGISKNNPNKRVKQLQTGNSQTIEVLKYYESFNYKKIEKWMHRQYAFQRTEANNEWFYLSNDEVMSFMNDVKKADADISFLLQNNSFYR